ncbi:MAG: DUF934 domain-containing protein [Xanthobacteraceae bacterium]
MPLVKSGRIVDDGFVRWLDDAPAPDGAAVLVSHPRLVADGATLLRRNGPTGVIWPNNLNVAELAPYVDRLALIALVFPTFKDGRAYSQARILREQYRFGGELRATGHVLRDQFLFMLRAGFNTFEVVKDADAAAFAETIRRYSIFYQPTGDGRRTALNARLNRVGAAAAPVKEGVLQET